MLPLTPGTPTAGSDGTTIDVPPVHQQPPAGTVGIVLHDGLPGVAVAMDESAVFNAAAMVASHCRHPLHRRPGLADSPDPDVGMEANSRLLVKNFRLIRRKRARKVFKAGFPKPWFWT